MSSVFELLTSLKLPVWLVILLVLVTVFLNSKVALSLLRRKKKQQNVTLSTLASHPLFDYIDYLVNIRIPSLNFGNPFRTNAFRDILATEFRCYRDELTLVLGRFNNSTDISFFKELIKNSFNNAVDKYEYERKNLNIPNPGVVLGSYDNWQQQSTEFLYKSIVKMAGSELYENNCERLDAILTLYKTMFEVSILNVETGLGDINGRLNGLEYQSKLYNHG
jgi:hypothetical protein